MVVVDNLSARNGMMPGGVVVKSIKAEKERRIEPVAPSHQQMMLLGHEHAHLSGDVLVVTPYCIVL